MENGKSGNVKLMLNRELILVMIITQPFKHQRVKNIYAYNNKILLKPIAVMNNCS